MDKIEQAYLNGFIKASSGFGLSEEALKLLSSVEKAPAELENTSKSLIKHPVFGNHALPESPSAPHTIGQGALQGDIEYPIDQHDFKGVNDLMKDRFTGLKGYMNRTGNRLSNMRDWAGEHPVKAIAAGTAAGAVPAHLTGGMIGRHIPVHGNQVHLKDPVAAQHAYDTLHSPKDPLALESLFEKLKSSIGNHPVAYGAGAAGLAGLGGLGYYMGHHRKSDKPDLSDQPGVEENPE